MMMSNPMHRTSLDKRNMNKPSTIFPTENSDPHVPHYLVMSKIFAWRYLCSEMSYKSFEISSFYQLKQLK